MSESHLQVNLDGTTANRKTVLWPTSKKEQEPIIRSLFEHNNWKVSTIENQSGSFWKVVTSCNGKSLKLNLYISSVRDEDRQPDEFKMQLGNTYPESDETGWITLVLGIYTIAEGLSKPQYILSGYDKSRYDFSTNPSIRGTRTSGLQKAYNLGMFKTDKSILFRPEFIYYYIEYSESLFGKSVTQVPIVLLDNTYIIKQTNSYLAAIRTKPFLLLAGISGTGKSRVVRKLAQMTVTEELQRKYDKEYQGTNFEQDRWELHTPANFKLIQVKPNWHNSMDVVGYLTNIPEPHYVFTPFVEFIARAWQHQDVPFFLCLDEMNLAPVEEYFAEFLSAIESRAFEKRGGEMVYVTDPIIKPFKEFDSFKDKDGKTVNIGDAMVNKLFPEFKASDAGTPLGKIVEHFKHKGLTLPKNLIVIGTVNMDETTYSFSRKVLDRAMSFEMNDVDYEKFLKGTTDDELKQIREELKGDLNGLLTERPIEAKEVMSDLGKATTFVIKYLDQVNKLLNGTPFKLGYRAANEAMLYVKAAHDTKMGDVASALNDFTLMKILSRLEGDTAKMRIDPKDKRLKELGYNANEVKDKREESADKDSITILSCMHKIISDMLVQKAKTEVNNDEATKDTQEGDAGAGTESNDKKLSSLVKLESMMDQLNRERFVSYWN